MAANLRSAVRGAARRAVPEGLLVLFRGPRPNPAAAAPSPAEADQLAKKVDDAAKKAWMIQYTRRLIQEQKKMYESPKKKSSMVPWWAAVPFVVLFMSGYERGRQHGKRMLECQKT